MRAVRQIATLIAVVTFIAASAHAQHQYGCPHSAARGLGVFNQTSVSDSHFDRVASSPDWAVVTVGVGDVPGLMEDGIHLDQLHTTTTHYAVYKASTFSNKTYWMHEYGAGELVSSNVQGSEGVGDLQEIIADASEKKFVLANVTTMNVRADDVNWSNTIFTSPGEGPHTSDLQSFMAVNENFLAMLPPRDAAKIGGKTLFVTTTRAPDGEEILTLFTRTKHGKWVGFARSVTHYRAGTIAELRWHLQRIGNGGRLYVYGDDIPSIDFNALADSVGVDTVRRTTDVEKGLVETHRRLNQISDRKPGKITTTMVNSVPGTAEELANAGLPESGVDQWRAFRENIETTVTGQFNRRIHGKTEFIHELTHGSSDMLVIVAHSDGPAIYVGNERVTLEELQRLPKRNSAGSRARVAFLLSCDTGKLTKQQVGLFRTKMNSLATILIERNFVDQVIAPDHTIAPDETIGVLRDLLSGKSAIDVRGAHAGWQKIAVLRRIAGLV